MNIKVAIVGANGFIGSRAVEMLHLGSLADVRPIVRNFSGLAQLSRFDLDCRIADARDPLALITALRGCEAVVHAAAGDPATIVDAIAPVYRAAEQAGVKRLVYLSSASVHGQAPAAGTDESTPLDGRQPLPYNNAKVRAERRLVALRERGSVETVVLRPGIVTGPRSQWTRELAAGLLEGTFCWLNRGQGICNSAYVDNVVHAVHLALTAPAADRNAFLIGDEETVTWADLYRPIAEALGFEVTEIPEAASIERPKPWIARAQKLRARPRVKAALGLIPVRLRRGLEIALTGLSPPAPPAWSYPGAATDRRASTTTLEKAMLYRCAVKLAHTRARNLLGYCPIVTFAEGSRRTLGWMAFAGYPLTVKVPATAPPTT